jgi:hypothetical protein
VKKIALIIIVVMVAATGIFADDIFFPAKKGVTLVTANLNPKGKLESFARMTVKDVSGSGADMSITYLKLPLNKKKKPTIKGEGFEYMANVVNNVLEMDLRSVIDVAVTTPPDAPFEITGGTMELPARLSVGDKLEDAYMNMYMNLGITSISVDVSVTNHKCVAVESITVPAGTFECYKLTHTVAMSASAMGNHSKDVNDITTWYARGIGSVKSVVFDEKGKVVSMTELHELIR